MADIDALLAQANQLTRSEDWGRAADAWDRVVDAANALDPRPNFQKADLVARQAGCLSRAGRHDEARVLFAELHDYFCAFVGPDCDEALNVAGQWALADAAAGERAAGIDRLRTAVAAIEAAPDASGVRAQVTVVQRLAQLLQADGATGDALDLLGAWAARLEAPPHGDGERRFQAGQLLETLGEHAVRAERHADAVEALRRSIDHYEAVWGKGDDTTASALRTLADALDALGRRGEASAARRRADEADRGA